MTIGAVVVIVIVAIKTVVVIVTIVAASRSFQTQTGYRMQGTRVRITRSSSH